MLQRLTKARIRLLLDHPFFGTLISRLPCVEDTSVDTACTNGRCIRYNPNFFASLTDPELVGVLAHEVLHVANGHAWRRGSRDPAAWNAACDLAINHILVEAGLTLPQDAMMPLQKGMAAEQYYTAPVDEDEGSGPCGDGPASDPGGCGGVEDAPADDAEAMETEWKIAVGQAIEAAKSQGSLPSDLERMAKQIVESCVPWFVLLRDFVERSARNDYNWTRPNRRYIQQGIVLPTLLSEELPEIVVAIDTSGSIGQQELDQFTAEVSAVLEAYETTIHVMFADAGVAHRQTLTRADLPLRLQPRGGGGTDFRPVFDTVNREAMTPACLIYLTDGYGTFPTQEPDYPVLWAMTTEQVAPMGCTVRMKQ